MACCRVLDSETPETSNSGKGPGGFFNRFNIDSVDAMLPQDQQVPRQRKQFEHKLTYIILGKKVKMCF